MSNNHDSVAVLEIVAKYCGKTSAMYRYIADLEASLADARRDGGAAVLLAIAAQFDGMGDAAYMDDEYDRRDVWRNAAGQARTRAKQSDWIDAAMSGGKEVGNG